MRATLRAWQLRLFIGVGAVGVVVASIGCQGSTGGDDGDFRNDVFVSDDDTTGSMLLSLDGGSISIGDTASFSVQVVNSRQSGVSNINVICDSEQGVAIVEPQKGYELTDSSGHMSGVIGCERPGSYQLVCRLSAGANRRRFVTVNCVGDIPAGFQGFPDAAGGGLGGGAQNNDDGEVRITSVGFIDSNDFGAAATGGASIDISQISDCDGDAKTLDPEPFYDTYVALSVKNNLAEQVRFTSLTYSVTDVDGNGGTFTSKSLSLTQESDSTLASADGGVSKIFVPIFKAYSSAKYVGDPLGTGIRISNRSLQTVNITLKGTTASGEDVSITGRSTASFGDFGRCG